MSAHAQEFAKNSWGPIQIENQYPLAQLHLSLSPESAPVLGQGHSKLILADAWSSSAIKRGGNYTIDGETHQLGVEYVYGLLSDFDLSLSLPFLFRNAGVLDRPIRGWHDFFHLYQGFRDDLPTDDYNVSGIKWDGNEFNLRSGGALSSTKLSGKYSLSDDSSGQWSLEAKIGLPASDPAFGQQGLDGLLALLGSTGWQRLSLYYGGGPLIYSDTSVGGVDFNRFHFEGFGGLEYRLLESMSLLCSIYGGSKEIKNLPLHPGYTLYLDFGSKIRLSPNLLLDLLVRENPGASRGSADVTLLSALESAW